MASSLGRVNGGTLSYTDDTAALNTTYSYRIEALDPASNHSPQSTALTLTTAATRQFTLLPVADTYS